MPQSAEAAGNGAHTKISKPGVLKWKPNAGGAWRWLWRFRLLRCSSFHHFRFPAPFQWLNVDGTIEWTIATARGDSNVNGNSAELQFGEGEQTYFADSQHSTRFPCFKGRGNRGWHPAIDPHEVITR